VLFPWQICAQYRHPGVNNQPGKEETFRFRYGVVYLCVEGPETENQKAKLPEDKKDQFTVWHEVILNQVDQFTVEANKLHWFQAGPDGVVLSEFSIPSTDEYDIFTSPKVIRIP